MCTDSASSAILRIAIEFPEKKIEDIAQPLLLEPQAGAVTSWCVVKVSRAQATLR
jgi:hypothetical protein